MVTILYWEKKKLLVNDKDSVKFSRITREENRTKEKNKQ